MIDIDKNPEQQLHILEFLSDFKNHKNIRNRIKKTPFKILNAIYLLTKNNEKKGRDHHYPSFDLIADAAKCGRRQVSDFVNSPEIEIFCEIKRNTFTSNEYILKAWVYQWLRLFWRFGMMKYIHTKYVWWKSDFKKRINNWLVPLAQAGHSIRDIYERTLNKLSTRKPPKGNATNPLKGNTIKPTGSHKAFQGYRSNTEHPVLRDFNETTQVLVNRFSLKDGDVNMLMKSFSLNHHKRAIRLGDQWLKNGLEIESPVRIYQSCLNKTKRKECKWN